MIALRTIIFQLVNIVVFVAMRYVSAIAAILAGIGAADHYKVYGRYVYLPSTVVQLIVLIAFVRSKNYWTRLNAKIAMAIIVLLTILSFFEVIPGEIITFDKISYIFR
jgi:hypothetical protein